MYSYSWCPSSDVCQPDLWNNLNAWCEVGWIEGYKLDIVNDCGAIEDPAFCPAELVSSPGLAGGDF